MLKASQMMTVKCNTCKEDLKKCENCEDKVCKCSSHDCYITVLDKPVRAKSEPILIKNNNDKQTQANISVRVLDKQKILSACLFAVTGFAFYFIYKYSVLRENCKNFI